MFDTKRVLAILVIFPLGVTVCSGQTDEYAIPLRIEHDPGGSTIMYFGNTPAATYGIDVKLGEVEGPPLAMAFDSRWMNNRGRPSFGMGLLVNDFLPCPPNGSHKDTFALLLSDGMEMSQRWKLSWPDSVALMAQADSLFFYDPTPPGRLINMFRQHEYTIEHPESPARFRIYKVSRCPCVVARSEQTGDGVLRTFSSVNHTDTP